MSVRTQLERLKAVRDRSQSPKLLAIKLVVFLAAIGVVYLLRPIFQPPIYTAVYDPAMAIVGTIGLFGGLALWFAPPMGENRYESANVKVVVLGGLLVVGVVVGFAVGIPAGMVEERTIADQTMAGSELTDEFPDVEPENARVAPRAVSDVQTGASVSYRQFRLGDSDIARAEDGRLTWSYAVEPEELRNSIFEHQQGVVLADMTRMEDRQIEAIDDVEFEVGEGMFAHRSARWNLIQGDFWARYIDDPIEFTHEGTPYMAYPKTGHEWHLAPIPHTTPTWEGVALVHPDGTIEHLSPEEAQASEILEGQRLYPLYNAEREMGSLSFRGGIVNQMSGIGAHEDQVELADLPPGAGNTQPFVIDLAGQRMSYVTALEPYGEDTRGLDEVWFHDARTGELTYYATGAETLMGPDRAMGIVRSEDTRTNWGNDFEVVEPVPVTVGDELWWHSKVVPVDNTDVSRNVFVSAHSGEAVELYDTESVREFIRADANPDDVEGAVDVGEREQPGEPSDTEPADPDDPDEVAYYIVVTDEDGDVVDRIPITEEQDVSIDVELEDGPAAENETDAGDR